MIAQPEYWSNVKVDQRNFNFLLKLFKLLEAPAFGGVC